jgi:isoleucyl-tRNA synthetase
MGKNPFIPILTRPELDQYALSALNTLIKEVEAGFTNLEIHNVTGAIQNYLDGVVSNWWIRRSRRRFWDKNDLEHESAYQTLYEIIDILIRLLAPITPFITDYLYEKLIYQSDKSNPPSIHLNDYPMPNENLINPSLEKDMITIRNAIAAGRVARIKVNIKNRQPLLSTTLVIPDPYMRNNLNRFSDLLKEELNVKDVFLVEKAGELQSFQILPNLSTIGPKFRKKSKKVIQAIESLSESKVSDLINKIHETPDYSFELDGFQLSSEDVNIKVKIVQGFEAEEFTGGLIFLNLDLSDFSLVNEGIARDIIRRIQSMRKDLELNYDSSILTQVITSNEKLLVAVTEYKELIENETLTINLNISNEGNTSTFHKWDISAATGEKFEFFLKIQSR